MTLYNFCDEKSMKVRRSEVGLFHLSLCIFPLICQCIPSAAISLSLFALFLFYICSLNFLQCFSLCLDYHFSLRVSLLLYSIKFITFRSVSITRKKRVQRRAIISFGAPSLIFTSFYIIMARTRKRQRK